MQGQFSEVALDLVARDGTKIPVLAFAAERHDEDGALLYTRLVLVRPAIVASTNAISSSRVDSAASTMRDERATSELREEFIAVLGHDLRNPLAAIASGSRLLKREPNSDRAGKSST